MGSFISRHALSINQPRLWENCNEVCSDKSHPCYVMRLDIYVLFTYTYVCIIICIYIFYFILLYHKCIYYILLYHNVYVYIYMHLHIHPAPIFGNQSWFAGNPHLLRQISQLAHVDDYSPIIHHYTHYKPPLYHIFHCIHSIPP